MKGNLVNCAEIENIQQEFFIADNTEFNDVAEGGLTMI